MILLLQAGGGNIYGRLYLPVFPNNNKVVTGLIGESKMMLLLAAYALFLPFRFGNYVSSLLLRDDEGSFMAVGRKF